MGLDGCDRGSSVLGRHYGVGVRLEAATKSPAGILMSLAAASNLMFLGGYRYARADNP